MLVSDIKTRIKRQFGDEGGVQVEEADMVRWINDGQREIIMQTEDLLQTSVLTNSVAQQQDYAIPADLFILRSLKYKAPGYTSFTRLQSMGMQEFDLYADGWEGQQYGVSMPQVYTVYAGQIRLFPIPAQAGVGDLKLYYSRKPTDVALDSDSIDLPDAYFNALLSYCLTKAYEMDEDWGAAANLSGQMQQDVKRNSNRHNLQAWEVYPTMTIRPEDL